MKRLRTVIQVSLVVATAIAGVRFALGHSLASVEKYCPFGGLETAYALVTRERFTCAAGELNLALFLALLLLTILARKAFCGWVCPLGAIFEWTGRAGRRIFRWTSPAGLARAPRFPRRLDAALQVILRVAVLAIVLAATWTTGELVFRGYDPYYILFSAHGHDVRTWSYAILGGLLLAGLVVPLVWCRYLCPLGTALWPLAALGRMRLVRSDAHCTGCAACDQACPQALVIAGVPEIRSGECTLCLECTSACPSPGALQLHWRGAGR